MADYLLELAPGSEGEDRRKLAYTGGKLKACGSYLVFRHYPGLDHTRLHAAKFCQVERLCPLCAIRRASKLLRRHSERAAAVLAENRDTFPAFCTFTVLNGPQLVERVDHLTRGLKVLQWRSKQSGRRKQRSEATVAWGTVRAVEIKRGKGSNIWHPHAHAVWFCHREPHRPALSREWKEITGDSHVVHVRPFAFYEKGLAATPENIAQDFVEVFKYPLKFSEMSCPDNFHAWESLHRRRLVASTGKLHGVEVPDDLLDEPLDVADEPYTELIFRYAARGGTYRRGVAWSDHPAAAGFDGSCEN